jgi:hypothetical protein
MYSSKIDFDKFYTKPDVAKLCLNSLDLDCYDLVIEPSAGNGSFYEQINHPNKIGLDLEPENPNIQKTNWFEYNIDMKYKKVLVVGNPPFGKRNFLSKKFLKHSCSFSNVFTVAFILPNVYNKHTLQKTVPIEYRLKTILELKQNSFTIGGLEYSVPCSFFVFEKSDGECLRFSPEKYIETNDWKFGNETDYDFFVMGAALNTIKDKPTENNRGYRIKVKPNADKNLVMENFKKMKIKSFSSANGGVAWHTKPEVVKNYLDNFDKDYFKFFDFEVEKTKNKSNLEHLF